MFWFREWFLKLFMLVAGNGAFLADKKKLKKKKNSH